MKYRIKFSGMIVGVMITLSSFGQTNNEVVNVSRGDTINYLLSKGFQYFFPKFEQGRVYFKNSESTTALLNYNILSNEIHFISPEKQATKAFSNGEEIRLAERLMMNNVLFVLIGNQVFINTPRGIMRVVANFDTKLLEFETVTNIGDVKVGGYGQPMSTGAATSVTSIDNSGPLSANSENVSVSNTSRVEYKVKKAFFLQKENRVYSASTAKQVGKVFPSIKSDIISFVQQNKTDFTNLADMKKLLLFCLEKTKASK